MTEPGSLAERPKPDPRIVSFAEIPSLKGLRFSSAPFTVSREETSRFETLTYFRPLTAEEASSEVEDGLIEGFHALALLDVLFNEHLRFDRGECYVLNYGCDRLRFPSQMTIDRPLRFEMSVADVTRRGAGFIVSLDTALGHERATKPGLVTGWKLFVARRA